MCENVCMCVFSGQHLAHSPLMMSMPDDVMVLIIRVSVMGFGVNVWRDRERKEEEVGSKQRAEEKRFSRENGEKEWNIFE